MFGAAFDQGLQHLEHFKTQHGHCDVPIAYVTTDGYKLGRWCSNQRTRLKNRVGDDDYARLSALGFSFDPAEDAWRAFFSEVLAYVDRNGSTSLPTKYVTESGIKIGAWVSRQRALARADKLPREKFEKLASLGLLD